MIKCIPVGLVLAAASLPAYGALIDDFSSPALSPAYTQTAILDNGSPLNVNFAVSDGGLGATYTGTNSNPEQVVLLRSDFSLTVGNVLRADVNWTSPAGSQDLGIMVAATATPNITTLPNGPERADYLHASIRADANHVVATGFNGTTGFPTDPQLQDGGAAVTGLFIYRASPTEFQLGYVRNGTDTVLRTLTVGNTDIGNAVGFYTDMRLANSIGTLDNLRIEAIPEPGDVTLLGIASLAALGRRRRA